MPQVAPGVYWNELDRSQYVPNLSDTIAAIVGTASKGPIGERTLVPSRDALLSLFGPPEAAHPALYAGAEYVQQGRRLYFTRVESGASGSAAVQASVDVTLLDARSPSFSLKAKDKGSFYNGIWTEITHTLPRDRRVQDPTGGTGAKTSFTLHFFGTRTPRSGGPLFPGHSKYSMMARLSETSRKGCRWPVWHNSRSRVPSPLGRKLTITLEK